MPTTNHDFVAFAKRSFEKIISAKSVLKSKGITENDVSEDTAASAEAFFKHYWFTIYLVALSAQEALKRLDSAIEQLEEHPGLSSRFSMHLQALKDGHAILEPTVEDLEGLYSVACDITGLPPTSDPTQ